MQRLITLIFLLLLPIYAFAQGSATGSGAPSGIGSGNPLEIQSSAAPNAVSAFRVMQQSADGLFAAKDYLKALNIYKKLAMHGDKFSQFRVAMAYELGLGVPKDLVEAYAWSYLAAENQRRKLVEYHISVRQQLTAQQLDNAKPLSRQYIAGFGNYAVAVEARKVIRSNQKQCTGSRTGGSCSHIGVFTASCNQSGDPSGQCLTIGSVGLAGVAGAQSLDVRNVLANLEQTIIDFNPGSVELGELEIIED